MTDQTDAALPAARPGVLRRLLAGLGVGLRPSLQPAAVPCPCGEGHEFPVGVPPVLGLLVERARSRSVAAEVLGSREWVVAFADRVKAGDVINIPHGDVAGVALRVLEVRAHDDGGDFERAVTFLASDVADPSRPYSPTLSVHAGLRIAVSAPDSLADFAGGGS